MSRTAVGRITATLTTAALMAAVGAAGSAGSAPTSVVAADDTPDSSDYSPPSLDDVAAETMRQVRVADGEGSQVVPGTERYVQIESPAHFADTPYEVGQDVDLWIIPPEGEPGQFFGTFEIESEVDPDRYWSMLGPVTFAPEAFDYSGVYAAALTDRDGELLAWQRTVLELEGEEVTDDSPGGIATGTWPVQEGDDPEPVTGPPALEGLTEEGYGRVYIQEDSPVIPLDRPFTAVFEDTTQPADYWLLPPEGSEAIWLPKEALTGQEFGEVHAELIVSSEDVESTGIYALAAKNVSGNLIGWTPFGISVDGDSIQPGEPGVNAEDTNTDRSIFPIPDSVPVPNDEDNDDEQSQPEETSSPAEEPTSDDEGAEAASETSANTVSGWAIALAAAAGALVVAGLLYLISSGRRGSG